MLKTKTSEILSRADCVPHAYPRYAHTKYLVCYWKLLFQSSFASLLCFFLFILFYECAKISMIINLTNGSVLFFFFVLPSSFFQPNDWRECNILWFHSFGCKPTTSKRRNNAHVFFVFCNFIRIDRFASIFFFLFHSGLSWPHNVRFHHRKLIDFVWS